MSESLPVRFKIPFSEGGPSSLEKIITEIIEKQGSAIFLRLLREKASTESPAPEPSSWLASTRKRVEGWIQGVRSTDLRVAYSKARETIRSAKTLPAKLPDYRNARKLYQLVVHRGVEWAVLSTLYSAGYLGGIVLGTQLPDIDYRLHRQGSPKDEITVHSAPVFTVRLGLEWLQEIFTLAAVTEGLGELERKQLQSLEAMLQSVARGVSQGASLPRWGQDQDAVQIRLDDSAFRMADQMFSTLSDKKPTEEG